MRWAATILRPLEPSRPDLKLPRLLQPRKLQRPVPLLLARVEIAQGARLARRLSVVRTASAEERAIAEGRHWASRSACATALERRWKLKLDEGRLDGEIEI